MPRKNTKKVKRQTSRTNVATEGSLLKRTRNEELHDMVTIKSATALEIFHRFPDLPPEIRTELYHHILDNHFAEVKRKRNPYHPSFAPNAIPYVSCKHALVDRNREIRGLEDGKLPAIEIALRIHERFYKEFVGLRIARSELWLIPALKKEYFSNHGHYYSYDWSKLRMFEVDMKHLEHISFSICSTHDDYPATPNLAYQSRLIAAGKTLTKLASDNSLPNLSRITIVLANQFFIEHTIPGRAWVFARRYELEDFFVGLRSLLQSGKLRKFEIRLGAIGRYTERTKDIQVKISKLLGQNVELEERGGCPKCQGEGVSNAGNAYKLSMIWKSDKRGRLAARDSVENIQVRRHIQHCQEPGCGDPMEFVPIDGWKESEDDSDEIISGEEGSARMEGYIGWDVYKGGWYLNNRAG